MKVRPLLLFELYLILSGVLSPADPGVLEGVANRRAIHFGQVENWREYEVLTATPRCEDLGRSGWLIAGDRILTALVVDCAQEAHRQPMIDNGLLADANMESLGHLKGWLVLR